MSGRQPLSLLARGAIMAGSIFFLIGFSLLVLLYFQVEHEVDELQYAQLTEYGKLLLNHLDDDDDRASPSALKPVSGTTTLAFALYDHQGRLLAQSHTVPLVLPEHAGGSRFFVQTLGQQRWRCARFADASHQIVVGLPVSLRDSLALEIASDLLLPVSLALLLLLMLAIAGLWYGLQPLRQFSAELGKRAPANLAPLPVNLPQELVPIARQLNELFARIEDTIAREQRFTGDAAHELRTPLAGLQVQLEVARHSPRPEARTRALGQLQLGVERMGRLVTQLLALARLDAQTPLSLMAVDVPALIRKGLDEAGLDGSIVVMSPADWQADPDLLALILRNVLENSKRYGGEASRITIHVQGALVEIADTGPGVAPEWLARLGERFVRPPGQEQSGSGLGLSIVRRAAGRMQAAVSWRNGSTGGFVVSLRLPVREHSEIIFPQQEGP